MLEKLAKKRKPIAIIGGAVVLALLILEMLLGNPDETITILVATVIGLPLFYFGIVWGFKIVRINAPPKDMRICSWFILIVCAIGIVVNIRFFPDGFSPFASCVMGVWLGILTDVEKHIEEQ